MVKLNIIVFKNSILRENQTYLSFKIALCENKTYLCLKIAFYVKISTIILKLKLFLQYKKINHHS